MSATSRPDSARLSSHPELILSPCWPEQAAPRASAGRLGGAVKRGLDACCAAGLLVLLSPILLSVAAAVRLDGGQAVYRHSRVGRGGRSFGCLKFRSMVPDADAALARHLAENPDAAAEWTARRKLRRDPRVTRLGALLRASSLDELPQLVNVLRGEMSLVGPRPVVREELEQHYDRAGRDAYAATRPGITGLWQISGRSDTSYAERVALDIEYASTRSLRLDLLIMLRTVPAVLARRGAV
jgi:lipopolysaccharide/colanic/teichoic acid biosynthesis glycosyltransferase